MLSLHALRVTPLLRATPRRVAASTGWNSRRSISDIATQNRIAHANLFRLVTAYREKGHLLAQIYPEGTWGDKRRVNESPLDLKKFGLDTTPGNTMFPTEGLVHMSNKSSATFAEILTHLNRVYCSTVGIEMSHLKEEEQEWLAQVFEHQMSAAADPAVQRRTFELMQASEAFDRFLHTKFRTLKRYGLEGLESTMPSLDAVFSTCAKRGLEEVVITMAHRGRTNILTGILDYPKENIFAKIKGRTEISKEYQATGDVLSHIAQSTTLGGYGAGLKVSMIHNPSHLEASAPVAVGKTRAKQDAIGDNGKRVACLMLHGDAAFCGQGVVAETLQMAELDTYEVGGTIHIVQNNLLGFTAAPHESRSNLYTTDIGKTIQAPILHVAADHPDDVVRASTVASEFRSSFLRDVFVDIIGYRRHGHNEMDEPSFTQPHLYESIRSRPSVVDSYSKTLVGQKVISDAEVGAVVAASSAKLEKSFALADATDPYINTFEKNWKEMRQPKAGELSNNALFDTGVSAAQLRHVGEASVQLKPNFSIHPRLGKLWADVRLERLKSGQDIDWATAEALAFGSLMTDGYSIRLSGQDAKRGTFSQRHLVVTDQVTEEKYTPLNNLKPFGSGSQPARLNVANSPLSENSVMAFEYGYSWENPNWLTLWESQFGDFFNGAQVVLDQFVSSGEDKWLRQSGLVLLLPHGYDGAGPEHSSCRIERFLQQVSTRSTPSVPLDTAADDNVNMQVVNPTTPANYFHALRRQMVRPFRKPLVVVGPKTLIRDPNAVSELKDMEPGTAFQPVISDTTVTDPSAVQKVVFCSGKVYYDLAKAREDKKAENVAIVRLEELSPFPYQALAREIKQFPNATTFRYCQEEPENMGAWQYVRSRLEPFVKSAGSELNYVGRVAAAAPAVGIGAVHKQQNEDILSAVFE
eukprot:TRINITY_DN7288_c0_g1_i1.p1 TRINITY_DN7288_c0_g1~~TRINITY_DN7288_c0_g1_i1.p1  ORF type:complete len:921 (+),score=200.16 TRINITY_DN7288_c0_g1_i1:137-2899(+)